MLGESAMLILFSPEKLVIKQNLTNCKCEGNDDFHWHVQNQHTYSFLLLVFGMVDAKVSFFLTLACETDGIQE